MSAPPGHRNGWRIIVTDDNFAKLSSLTQTLRDAGHCVFAAYDGQSALELVALLPDIDILITNTRLGIVDGAALMRRTRQMRPDMPILHVSHDPAPSGITPPGVPTINEPYTPNQLLLVIGSLLA